MNVETYELTGRAKYAAFAAVVTSILRAALKVSEPPYRLQQVADRAKDVDSLRRKIAGRTTEPTAIEDDIKDLAGCRIIFYTNADVSRFLNSDIMRDNFEVLDRKVHQPGRAEQDAGKLYIASHFVVRLRPERAALAEYSSFAGLKCEVQVVTILNHTLAEIGHDTIYKTPEMEGFGEKAIANVRRRMAKVMRERIVPAGYELQQITSDFERMMAGKEAFDEGALEEIVEAADNNERHAALERLLEQVLPNFDDMEARYPGLLHSLEVSAERALAIPDKPIETPFASYPGKTTAEVLKKIADIMGRYWPLDSMASIDSIFYLYAMARTDDERKPLLSLGEEIASHNMHAWKQVGPAIQEIVVERCEALAAGTKEALRGLLLKMLGEVLQPDIKGTTSSSNTVTFHTGPVPPSERLANVRRRASALIGEFVRASKTEEEFMSGLGALDNASHTPSMTSYGNDFLRLVIGDLKRIVELHGELAAVMPFEVLRTREDRMLRWHRTYSDLPESMKSDEGLSREAADLVKAIESFRDTINANREFVIYKTLVGYDSVFPPAWTSDEFHYSESDNFRKARAAEFVDEVNEDTKEYWYRAVRRCAATKSPDLATFPAFGEFLSLLGERKPAVLLWMIGQMEGDNG